MRGTHRNQCVGWENHTRFGYFWPTIREDAREIIQACNQCQIYANDRHVPQNSYPHITSPIPFAQWGMDLLRPFPRAKGGKEYLVIAINYFTRLAEVKALSSIMSKQIQDFF